MLLLLLLPTASLARAQSVESTLAQSLFDQGRGLLEAGHVEEACGKLEESQRLEPAIGTLLNLALCNERRSRTASAWLNYRDALTLASREQNPSREQLARERIAALEPTLAHLVVAPPREPPDGLWMSLDGVNLGPAAWGVPLPIDRVPHTLRAGAPGRRAVELAIPAPEAGQSTTLSIPELVLVEAPRAVPAVDEAVSLRRTLAGASAGLAVAATGAAVYASLEARRAWRERQRHCPAAGCDQRAAEAGERARRFAIAANTGFAVGAVAAGAALTLFLWRGRSARRTHVGASLAPGSAEVQVGGMF
jgi:hypothetical protein